jgi:hypothetical protein
MASLYSSWSWIVIMAAGALPFVIAVVGRAMLILVAAMVLMSTHASILVDSVGPPSAEFCRTAASFP